MIITRTPMRISLGGGGSDLPSFYQKYGGFVFSMAIDKYMHVFMNQSVLDDKVHLHYTKYECVDDSTQLEHELAREALKAYGIYDKIIISSIADIHAGTGLGSSSSYLVGLLTALEYQRSNNKFKKMSFNLSNYIAEMACHIEIDILKKGIGKQDQYIAAYGGLQAFHIDTSGKVIVVPIFLDMKRLTRFIENTHLYYTGLVRNSEEVLKDQNEASKNDNSVVIENLLSIKEIGKKIYDAIVRGDFDSWGILLDEHWKCKRSLSNKISTHYLDEIYDQVKKDYGVLGGKIVGAGGGGFLMLYQKQINPKLQEFMESENMPRLNYFLEYNGSMVL